MIKIKNSKVVLPLQKPILTTWSSESHLFSIIQNNPNSFDWIMNNYIQIIGIKKNEMKSPSLTFVPRHDPTDPNFPINAWNTCPFIDVRTVASDFIGNNHKSVIEYIISAINLGYYVYLDLDQFFRHERNNETGFIHKNFIYGYNLNEKIFFIADHFNVGKYATSTITFPQLYNAYRLAYDLSTQIASSHRFSNSIEEFEAKLCEPRKILIVKPKKYSYKFNIDLMKMYIKDYLMSSYSFDSIMHFSRENEVTYFIGLENYNLLQSYLENFFIDIEYQVDFRVFTFLRDQKSLLKMRIVYLQKQKLISKFEYLIDTVTFIENESIIIVNMFIKFSISRNKEIIIKIIDKLKLIKEEEKKLLNFLLKCF